LPEPTEIEETGVPEGIINFLQKRKRTIIPTVKDMYWINDIVVCQCQRKAYYKQLGIEEAPGVYCWDISKAFAQKRRG
jgi:hypothetical protein